MDIKISEETGLPEVPKGYFWRISRHEDRPDDTAVVELRVRRRLFGSSVARRDIAVFYKGDSGQDNRRAIRYAAEKAYLRAFRSDLIGDYLGDYPPRRLS
jgi:hypothetical protein